MYYKPEDKERRHPILVASAQNMLLWGIAERNPERSPIEAPYRRAAAVEGMAHEFFHRYQAEKFSEVFESSRNREVSGGFTETVRSTNETAARKFAYEWLRASQTSSILEKLGKMNASIAANLREIREEFIARQLEKPDSLLRQAYEFRDITDMIFASKGKVLKEAWKQIITGESPSPEEESSKNEVSSGH